MHSSADSTRESFRPRRRKTSTRRFPMQAVVIGIVVGAGLGIGLAQGILAFVYEQREMQRREQEATADTIAAEQLMDERKERRSMQENSEWFRWATEKRSP